MFSTLLTLSTFVQIRKILIFQLSPKTAGLTPLNGFTFSRNNMFTSCMLLSEKNSVYLLKIKNPSLLEGMLPFMSELHH